MLPIKNPLSRHNRHPAPNRLGNLLALLLGALLEAATVAAPVFLAVPRFLWSNAAGTALVSFALGPGGGGLFAAAMSVILNRVTGGSGIIFYILLLRVLEGVLIGLCARKVRGWRAPLVAALLLSILMKPLTLALSSWWYALGSSGVSLLRAWLASLQNEGLVTLEKYLFTCVMGYGLHRFLFAQHTEAPDRRSENQIKKGV